VSTCQSIIDNARVHLNDPNKTFWSDAELLVHLNAGAKDCWRHVQNLLQDYFFQIIEDGTVTQDVNATTLTIATSPTPKIYKIQGIEPVTQANYPALNYFPRKYMHPDMVRARTADAVDPGSCGPAYYAIAGRGNDALPTIYVAPKFTAQVPIRLVFTPGIGTLLIGDANPIPGESDQALENFIVAYAKPKETDEDGAGQNPGTPDAGWLAMYKAERDSMCVSLDPRQEDQPDVAEGVHENFIE
jgi:hypothetical protein